MLARLKANVSQNSGADSVPCQSFTTKAITRDLSNVVVRLDLRSSVRHSTHLELVQCHPIAIVLTRVSVSDSCIEQGTHLHDNLT